MLRRIPPSYPLHSPRQRASAPSPSTLIDVSLHLAIHPYADPSPSRHATGRAGHREATGWAYKRVRHGRPRRRGPPEIGSCLQVVENWNSAISRLASGGADDGGDSVANGGTVPGFGADQGETCRQHHSDRRDQHHAYRARVAPALAQCAACRRRIAVGGSGGTPSCLNAEQTRRCAAAIWAGRRPLRAAARATRWPRASNGSSDSARSASPKDAAASSATNRSSPSASRCPT